MKSANRPDSDLLALLRDNRTLALTALAGATGAAMGFAAEKISVTPASPEPGYHPADDHHHYYDMVTPVLLLGVAGYAAGYTAVRYLRSRKDDF